MSRCADIKFISVIKGIGFPQGIGSHKRRIFKQKTFENAVDLFPVHSQKNVFVFDASEHFCKGARSIHCHLQFCLDSIAC